MTTQGMKNIREHSWGFQLYFKRDKKLLQPCFSIRQWGSRQSALQAAISQRDQLKAALPPVRRREPLAHKRTTGVRGVTRRIVRDPRRGRAYLRYEAAWQDADGVMRSCTFSCGRADRQENADLEFHAFRSAVHFRRVYEACQDLGLRFHPEWFDGWRDRRVYEELPLGVPRG